jgi:elongation factor P--(R)-beta-lysine ligase
MRKNTLQPGNVLKTRHELLKSTREFFYKYGYIEVETPNLMKTMSPDPHIDPLTVQAGNSVPYYLHTSPEMHMKRLLQYGHERIFQICKVYRVEEIEEIHNIEFTMLEWYREGTYLQAMAEVEGLIDFIIGKIAPHTRKTHKRPYKTYELEGLFIEKTGINPFALSRDEFFDAMAVKGFRGIDGRDDWNDLFFKLFINDIEQKLGREAPYFIKDWPDSISTMAKKKDNNKVERFELYMHGLEIANGYTELLDFEEQRERFLRDNKERKRLGKDLFPVDEEFLEALKHIKGPCTGVSIGMDRLLMALIGADRIQDVMINRFTIL